MSEENISQEFRLKNIYETISYFLKEIEQNELMSKRHKEICTTLNCIEHLLILISAVPAVFCSFCFCSYRNYEFCNRIYVTTSKTKKYKSIIKKNNKKKHYKIVLLAKSKLNSIEVLISMVLIDSNISHDEFILINNVPKEFYDIKKEIKKFNSK